MGVVCGMMDHGIMVMQGRVIVGMYGIIPIDSKIPPNTMPTKDRQNNVTLIKVSGALLSIVHFIRYIDGTNVIAPTTANIHEAMVMQVISSHLQY